VKELSLSETVWIDLEITGAGDVVRLSFPDGTRSLLELVSWSSGRTICDAVKRIGEEYLRLLLACETVGRTGSGATPDVRSLEIPREFVRARLEVLVGLRAAG
jgi:hypothetical protein